jgi:hypothetical protein
MAYLLIDPPVSPLSTPAKIRVWIEELAARATDPLYSDPMVQKQLQHAIMEARDWLAATRPLPLAPESVLARQPANR